MDDMTHAVEHNDKIIEVKGILKIVQIPHFTHEETDTTEIFSSLRSFVKSES